MTGNRLRPHRLLLLGVAMLAADSTAIYGNQLVYRS